MLIFCLIGGSEAGRNDVMAQFSKLMGANGVSYYLPSRYTQSQRLALLNEHFNPKNGRHQRLQLNGILFLPEVQWVRDKGGYVVHVDAIRPSDVVPMQPRDFYVTPDSEPRGRFETVEQCYSSLLLRYKHDAMARHNPPLAS